MKKNIFFLMFVKFICILLLVVAAGQGQIESKNFARCPQKCFCLCESFNSNINSITRFNKVKAKLETYCND